MKIWRFILAGFIGLNIGSAQALSTLTNFTQLVQALELGNDVRAIIFFDRCTVTNPNIQAQVMTRLEGASTRINFNHFLHAKETINDHQIDTVVTTRDLLIETPEGIFLTMFSRLSVFDDNSAILHVVFFDPLLHKQRGVIDWYCTINNSSNLNLNLNLNTNLNINTNQNLGQTQNTVQTQNTRILNDNQIDNGLVLYNLEGSM